MSEGDLWKLILFSVSVIAGGHLLYVIPSRLKNQAFPLKHLLFGQVIFAFVWLPLAISPLAFALSKIALSLGASRELLRANQISTFPKRLIGLGIAFVLPLSIFFYPQIAFAWIFLILSLIAARQVVANSPRRVWLSRSALLQCGYVALGLALATTVRALPNGAALVLFYLTAIGVNDIAGRLCGELFGKTGLLTSVSPNKTREGAIGALCSTICFSLLTLELYQPGHSRLTGATLGLLISLGAQYGDLLFSALKRNCGIRNYGTLLQGHGGLLDRIDSTIPVAALVLLIMS